MKIYTKTGTTGVTGLFGGGRVPKDDERVDAYGEVEKLNATKATKITGDSGLGQPPIPAQRPFAADYSVVRSISGRSSPLLRWAHSGHWRLPP